MKYRLNDEIKIPIGRKNLTGEMIIPENAASLVIFSHGSGSSRFSTRNRFVAEELQKKNIATFLFDLLTREEDEVYETRFDIGLLTHRLVHVTRHVQSLPEFSELSCGYFGASTGAASALNAAAALPGTIQAVVSRGGRPDMAMDSLPFVKAPTLLVVGELDYDVIELNRRAYVKLNCEKGFEIVTGATHLFEEPGTLGEVAQLAAHWFKKYLEQEKEIALK